MLLQIFGQIAFDYNLETLENKGNNLLTQALNDMLNVLDIIYYAPRTFAIVYLKLHFRYQRARRIIDQYLNQMIEQELNENLQSPLERKRTCLIASLVASLQQDENVEAMKNEEARKGLSRNEVMNEILLFLVAGYETTSTVLSWFIYLMSKHPRVQQKIKDELQGKDLSIDHLDSLVYLECVIKEVLRLNPPADMTARTLTADDRLPTTGIQLYKGEQVLIPFYSLARDPQLWSFDPDSFYPERFLNEDKNHHPYASIPFGSGHRQCIGQDLARFELKVIAARLMQYVTFIDGGSNVNSGGYLLRLTMMPKNVGVKIQFDQEN